MITKLITSTVTQMFRDRLQDVLDRVDKESTDIEIKFSTSRVRDNDTRYSALVILTPREVSQELIKEYDEYEEGDLDYAR